MRWVVLITLLLAGCPTEQQIEDEEQFREEYRECLKDRIELIDKVAIMKTPEPLECPKEVTGVLTPELDKASTRDKCLYIIDRFGAGAFKEKAEAFRTCWDSLDDSHEEALWECKRDRDEFELGLESCKDELEKK